MKGPAIEHMEGLDAALRKAAKKGNAKAIRELMAQGAGVAGPDENGMTSLMLAASSKKARCVKLLLPVVNLGAKKSAGAALSICAQLGWAEGVRLLLDAIEGAAGGNPSTVRSFAKRGGGIGRTTLILAAGSACAECVELLLPLFEADAVDSDGKTALMVAAEAQKGAPAGCVAKLAAASNVLKRDWRGRNALHHAARCGLPEAVEILAPLIDPRLRDKECENALDATRARLDDDGERIRETLRRAIAERERGEIEAAAKEAGPPAGVALRARSL